MKDSINKNKKVIIPLIAIIVILFGLTNAWLSISRTTSTVNKITAGSLELELDDSTSDGILLLNQVPMSFRQGLTTTPYTFKLKNKSSNKAEYSISIEDFYDDVTIPAEGKMIDEKIRYILLKGSETPVATNSKLLSEGRTIDSGVISANTEVEYTLYIWINSTAGVDVNGQIFSGKLNVTATQGDLATLSGTTSFDTGSAINSKIESLATSLNNVGRIKRNATITDTYKTDEYKVSTSGSEKPIYMWYDNGTVYWYTTAATINLNQNSSNLFKGMTGLTTIENLEDFNTSSVTNMSSMFENCSSLSTLDLSAFTTSNVTTMANMFKDATNLTTIYASSSFNTTSQTDQAEVLFDNNTNLVGGANTAYDSAHQTSEYARIDTSETPGYFTTK